MCECVVGGGAYVCGCGLGKGHFEDFNNISVVKVIITAVRSVFFILEPRGAILQKKNKSIKT